MPPGIFCTMANDLEKFDKQERASRLKQARMRAGISGPKGVYDASGGAIDINLYKGHESGRNAFSVSEGRRYADLFGVPLTWLYLGIGRPEDVGLPGASKELRQAFAKVIDAPQGVQDQVISFIRFAVGQAQEPSQSPQDQHRDQHERANRHRAIAP